MALSDSEVARFQSALESLHAELRQGLEGSAEAARPVALDPPAVGRVSRIDAIQQQQMLEANRQAQRLRLQQVRSALRRIDADEYGDCLSCGEAVSQARLAARPETLYCLDCQRSRERRSSGG